MPDIDYQDWLLERQQLLRRISELEAENAMLRNRSGYEDEANARKEPTAMQRLSPQEKVELFRSLFKGRKDVFARRWVSKGSGKSGYQPVCRNEWKPLLCDKRKQKCAECPNREFSPLTHDAVYSHLAGKDAYGQDVIGLYVLCEDNTCYLLCADFDDKSCEHGYQDDVLAFVAVCKSWGVPCSVERSRSGNGAHVWVFFDGPVPSAKARQLGNAILTEAMNQNGRISFKSYDRFFPNQDALPEGGLGNLVALPLQGNARRNGNSVFVDERFEAHADQWEYLLHIERLSETAMNEILRTTARSLPLGELSKTSEHKPWEVPAAPQISPADFPSGLTATRANMLSIPIHQLSPKVLNHLRRIASFRNPEFYSRQALRLSTLTTPRIISCAEITDEYLALPRGCEDAVMVFLVEKSIRYRIEDLTNHGRPISVRFMGELRENQQQAVNMLSAQSNGVISATTAFGKTVAAIGLIAHHRVNTLILVHTNALLEQWKKDIETFLEIGDVPTEDPRKRGRKKPLSPVGTLNSTGSSLHGIIDIALMQSCLANGEAKTFVKDYGMVIVDECHHVSAVNFERIMKAVNARYVYGLTATPIRKDGHQPIIFMQCGPIRYTANAKEQIQSQTFERLLVPRFMPFRAITSDKLSYAQTIQQLAEDEYRNLLIVKDVCKALQAGRSPIVLTNRTAHVDALASLLRSHCTNVITLIGAEPTKKKREKLARLQNLPPTEPLVIVATGKYVGEGFDCPRLDTLFLALPVSWKGIVAQYAGRLHRDYEGKREVLIYDYIDIHVPLCESMHQKRLKGYAAVGYKIRTEELFACAPATPSLIYDGLSFCQPFIADLALCRRSVIIFSPKVRLGRHSQISDRLIDLLHRGVEIIVCTHEDNADTDRLRRRGLTIDIQPALALHAAILDRSRIWYGSVNILGYHSADDSLIRFRDAEVATTLLESLMSRNAKT